LPFKNTMDEILLLDSTESTNQDAFKLAQEGATHGFSVIATTQTGGRGRLGKSWQSIPGRGLYCSIILRPDLHPSQFPQLTLVAGLAVAYALNRLTQLFFSLKWPNDVYCNNKKCCGILSEASPVSGNDERFAIVGIGINVNTEKHEFVQELQDSATSLFVESGQQYEIEVVFEEVRRELLRLVGQFEVNGFKPLLKQWKKLDMLRGQWLQWVANSKEVVHGESLGPNEDGQLLVRDKEGNIHEVISGDIRLATRS
jgi:BirA family biotin operon repressor/biotin-[acetyl-CoA-carboxylase] ligase